MITKVKARKFAPGLNQVPDDQLDGLIAFAHNFLLGQVVIDTPMTALQEYIAAVVTQYFATQHITIGNPYEAESLGDWSYTLKKAREDLDDILDQLERLPVDDSRLPAIEKYNFKDWNKVKRCCGRRKYGYS